MRSGTYVARDWGKCERVVGKSTSCNVKEYRKRPMGSIKDLSLWPSMKDTACPIHNGTLYNFMSEWCGIVKLFFYLENFFNLKKLVYFFHPCSDKCLNDFVVNQTYHSKNGGAKSLLWDWVKFFSLT